MNYKCKKINKILFIKYKAAKHLWKRLVQSKGSEKEKDIQEFFQVGGVLIMYQVKKNELKIQPPNADGTMNTKVLIDKICQIPRINEQITLCFRYNRRKGEERRKITAAEKRWSLPTGLTPGTDDCYNWFDTIPRTEFIICPAKVQAINKRVGGPKRGADIRKVSWWGNPDNPYELWGSNWPKEEATISVKKYPEVVTFNRANLIGTEHAKVVELLNKSFPMDGDDYTKLEKEEREALIILTALLLALPSSWDLRFQQTNEALTRAVRNSSSLSFVRAPSKNKPLRNLFWSLSREREAEGSKFV